ncbi:MAG: TrkH family potassium uptake protein [Acholeplasmatales bacterium]|nr:TrkH family potassium uptake protein [Acholeplasmatales bacterium]
MNYGLIRNILGKIILLVGILMSLPLFVSLYYKEPIRNTISFLIPMASLLLIGFLMSFFKAKNTSIMARDGFVIVGLSWLLMSLFGCIPFIISKEIPNFFDAFFEITSGFTTTGSTILSGEKIDSLSKSMLFWRSFSHWIGGMGILVFILAFIPESKDGTSVHILRAESTGPKVGKLVSKMQVTSRILYLIYMGLTGIMFITLLILPDKKMGIFDSLITTFGTAGTGGFSNHGASIGFYDPCVQYTVGIFMILFGVNFSIYYLILIGQFKEAFKSEELWWYLGLITLAIVIVSLNVMEVYNNAEEVFRHSFFQVASIISTTGFSTTDYGVWPALSCAVLMCLTFIGSCAGSTAGGLKVSRLAIITKTTINDIEKMISPRKVKIVRMNNKPLDNTVIHSVKTFATCYVVIIVFCTLLISIYNPNMELDPLTAFSSSLTCISNVGPGFGKVGPAYNFSGYSEFSKMVLSIEMIAGRLEIFPILLLFAPSTWKKRV